MQEIIAKAYLDAPVLGPQAAAAWAYLAAEVNALYCAIPDTLRIEAVTGQPYATVEAMFADTDSGVLRVSTDNTEHPLWTPAQNVVFRAVHDYYGHYLTGADFSWQGELRAWGYLDRLLVDSKARHAQFCEVVGQAAAYFQTGEFQPQKCHLLPTWFLFHTGEGATREAC